MMSLYRFLTMLTTPEFVWCEVYELVSHKFETIAQCFADDIIDDFMFSNRFEVISFSIRSGNELRINIRRIKADED